jgi:hypothetical protein
LGHDLADLVVQVEDVGFLVEARRDDRDGLHGTLGQESAECSSRQQKRICWETVYTSPIFGQGVSTPPPPFFRKILIPKGASRQNLENKEFIGKILIRG